MLVYNTQSFATLLGRNIVSVDACGGGLMLWDSLKVSLKISFKRVMAKSAIRNENITQNNIISKKEMKLTFSTSGQKYVSHMQ